MEIIRSVLNATGIYSNGRFDGMRLLLCGVPIILFMLWRLSAQGVSGADEALRALERELIADYKTEQYHRAGLLDDSGPVDSTRPFVDLGLDGLTVRLSDVSMSGSLFSWSIDDPIGIRFDYEILRNGERLAGERGVYRCTHRKTRSNFWDCGAVSYYLKYL